MAEWNDFDSDSLSRCKLQRSFEQDLGRQDRGVECQQDCLSFIKKHLSGHFSLVIPSYTSLEREARLLECFHERRRHKKSVKAQLSYLFIASALYGGLWSSKSNKRWTNSRGEALARIRNKRGSEVIVEKLGNSPLINFASFSKRKFKIRSVSSL